MWKKQEKKIDYENLSRDESYKIFKKLLSDIGVTASWRWKDTMRIIQNEERSKALKTIHDQRKAFNEYIADYRQREREETRQKKKHLKEQFKQMLDESKIMTSQTKYYNVFLPLPIDCKIFC